VVAYSVETSGKVEDRLVGHVANLASRLESLALVGSIATSDYTRSLCQGYFELQGLGPTAVKGLNAPIEVYEVIGLGPLRTHFQLALQRGLTKFIGREHELAQLRRALQLAIDRNGQIVAVMAEAGTYPHRRSLNLSHIPGDSIATAYFRPQLPPELEFDTDTLSPTSRIADLRPRSHELQRQPGTAYDSAENSFARNTNLAEECFIRLTRSRWGVAAATRRKCY
jgi:hypothetical protein